MHTLRWTHTLSAATFAALTAQASCGGRTDAHPAPRNPQPQGNATARPNASGTSTATTTEPPPKWEPPAACTPPERVTKTLAQLLAEEPPRRRAPATISRAPALPMKELGTVEIQANGGGRATSLDGAIVEPVLTECRWAVVRDAAPSSLKAAITAMLTARHAARTSADPGEDAAQKARVARAALVETLEAEDKVAKNPVVDLALGILVGEAAAARGNELLQNEALAAATARSTKAAEGARDGTAVGAYARLDVAKSLERTAGPEAASKELDRLKAAPLTWAHGGALFEMAGIYDRALRNEEADALYRAAERVDPALRLPSDVRRVGVAERLARWDDVAALARDLLSLQDRPGGVDDALEAALARAIDRLGGAALDAAVALPPDRFARVASLAADEALARLDHEASRRAWQALADRAPGALELPVALHGLAHLAAERGENLVAAAIRARISTITASSPWADALRARRDADGHPNDEEITRAVDDSAAELLPSAPLDRVRALAERCSLSVPPGFRVDLRVVARSDGSAVVVATTPTPGAQLDCLRDEGPRYFVGVKNGVHAVLVRMFRPIHHFRHPPPPG